VQDVRRLGATRPGDAVRLAGLLQRAGCRPAARYLGLHSETDNFHASIPLDAVRERGLLIYRADGRPLPVSAGGPFRFFIPDHHACHTDEIDECANVKFLDHIELTARRGFDNRPQDDQEHARLHRQERRGPLRDPTG
jgi:DMSO/TMAO reductase YedYZ molybdopterin-dependent catalytic subunit